MKLLSCTLSRIELLLVVFYGWMAAVNPVFAQTWTQTSAPSNNWVSVAASADGTKLVAAAGQIVINGYGSVLPGSIYLPQFRLTWNATPAPVTNWISVDCSGDGTILIAACLNAAQTGGAVYLSTNSGAAWTQAKPTGSSAWNYAVVSASGNMLVVGNPQSPAVYYSTNSGGSWQSGLNFSLSPILLTISADGSRLVGPFLGAVPAGSGNMMTITNPPTAGGSWNWTQLTNAPYEPWSAIASSANSSQLIASVSGSSTTNCIYISTNSGFNWEAAKTPTNQDWDAVASSADGSSLLAVFAKIFSSSYSPIFLSTNGGSTWMTNTLPGAFYVESHVFFSSVAMSADSGLMVASIYGGGIWTARSTLPPRLNAISTGNNLALSWTVPSTNFVLQEISDLTTGNWWVITNAPVLNLTNLQNQISLAPTISPRFLSSEHSPDKHKLEGDAAARSSVAVCQDAKTVRPTGARRVFGVNSTPWQFPVPLKSRLEKY